MDKKMLEMLKNDLAKAIALKDHKKIEELKKILSISVEQSKYIDKGLTGYPSIDRVWLKQYPEGSEERALAIPVDKTVWDIVEEKLNEFYDVPAIEYFGKVFSRPEFIEMCYTWARAFRAMGVEENEIVPIYGVFIPEIAAMFFGLNMIGACPYFLKLDIHTRGNSLEEETREAKRAVVFDAMWGNVANEFMKDKYKNVFIANATMDMPFPKKQIVSLLSKFKSMKEQSGIPHDKKYIWLDKAMAMAKYYTGEVKVPFVPERRMVITSSSGTSGALVKGAEATNESVLGQVYSMINSDIPYEKGFRTLNHFPPAAATSLNSLFLVAMMTGATVVMDPRVDIDAFYWQLEHLGINACINTSSLWNLYFAKLVKEIQQGKVPDFRKAKAWMVGGEGPDMDSFEFWARSMRQHGGDRIYSGYGLTETFSGVAIDRVNSEPDFTKPVVRAGLVQAGMIAAIVDKDGNELTYNQRGELWIKSKSHMKGYYGKPELTKKTLEDGWIKTGDIAEIDEQGFLYVWGRASNVIKSSNGEEIYAFDIENKIRETKFIKDVMVLAIPTEENDNNLVAHIVWKNEDLSLEEKKNCIEIMNERLKEFLPDGIVMSAYSEHEYMLPFSGTTLKKDKNGMSKQTLGYVQVVDGELKNIKFVLNESGKYSQEYDIMEEDKRSGLFGK